MITYEHFDSLINDGKIDTQAARFLNVAVQAKVNILIIGPREVDKLELLTTLCNSVPTTERVIVIEDDRTIQVERINTPIWLAKTSKDKSQLLHTAAKMQSGRIVLSELRGEEIDEFIEVYAKFPGSMSTFVAKDAEHAVGRLTKLMPDGSTRVNQHLEIMKKRIISSYVELIVSVSPTDTGWRISDISEVILKNNMQTEYRTLFETSVDSHSLHCLGKKPSFDQKRKKLFIEDQWYTV